MFQEFCITAVDTNLQNKTVIITASFDIDPSTVNDATVQLYEENSRNFLNCTRTVIGKTIQVVLTDWPLINTKYTLSISSIKTILGDNLTSGILREIYFDSSITSTINITRPISDEVVSSLNISWTETLGDPSKTLINSYYIEISDDVAFHNIVLNTNVTGETNITLADLTDGQYFIRCRAQTEQEYGAWSDVITFIFGSVGSGSGSTPSTPDATIYVPEIEILSSPDNGVTPTSFIIQFDKDIDPSSLTNIVVLRGDL